MASRIFSLDLLGSSEKPGSAWTHFQRSAKRRLTTSTSGWRSSSSMAMSWTSVQRMLLLDHHVAGRRRQRDGEPVQLRRDLDLAAEPRSVGQAEGQVQHVLLILGRRLQQLVPLGIDDDMASRAGQRTLAGALEIDVVLMGDLQH